ncbi:GntP family permease [Aestuariibacter sp. GS-14]|uniref:GntP family permease n=1 Tax=Aestuariibacter sp. GS-14 TaxID=2590670 RepID=UPI00112E6023|nr:GntP family permease [Aestuariibacter sp. GS-14]TPV59796.1 GntP family permease [Aestuariibacter sp. GS-14]
MLLLSGGAMVGILMLLVIVVRMHAFIALILVSFVTALVTGVDTDKIVSVMLSGFGGTLAAVALLVGLGGMIGKLLDASGGADVLSKRLLDLFGEQRAPFALGVASLLFGFPIFFDAGLIVMMPVLLTVARKLGKSTLPFVLPAAGAFAVMHAFVPPHPGPVAAADLLGVNMGMLLLVGLLVAIPTWFFGAYLFGLYAGTKYPLPVPTWFSATCSHSDVKSRPSFWRVILILITPLVLISLDTVANTLLTAGVLEQSTWVSNLRLLGKTPVALMITLLLTLWLLRAQFSRMQLESLCNDALGPLCAVILITGAGGMFGGVLRASGIGDALAGMLAETGLPIIVAAFILSSCIRVAQGSATVALTTTAALLAPVVAAQTGLSAMDLCCIVIAIAGGATVLSHVNDSGFWLVSRLLNMDEKTTLKTWTVMETLLGSLAFLFAGVLSWLF